jgi:hypothetical protein
MSEKLLKMKNPPDTTPAGVKCPPQVFDSLGQVRGWKIAMAAF